MTREEDYLSEWCPDRDEDDFFIKVRIWSKWDQQHFERMVHTATEFLDEMEDSHFVDHEKWDASFISSISNLIVHMKHPGFLAGNKFGINDDDSCLAGLSDDSYREYIYEKIEILKTIQMRYQELRTRFSLVSDSTV